MSLSIGQEKFELLRALPGMHALVSQLDLSRCEFGGR